MLPMAFEDYKHRNIGVPLLIIFLLVSGVLGILTNAISFAGNSWLALLIVVSILLTFILYFFLMLEAADVALVIGSIWALGFIGSLGFFAAIILMVVVALLFGKLNRKGIISLPFITIYLFSIFCIFFFYLIAVALRL